MSVAGGRSHVWYLGGLTMSTCIMSNGYMGTTQYNDRQTTVKTCSHRAKVNAKAKKVKEQSEEIKKISGKHQRKFSLLLGVGRSLNDYLPTTSFAGDNE